MFIIGGVVHVTEIYIPFYCFIILYYFYFYFFLLYLENHFNSCLQ